MNDAAHKGRGRAWLGLAIRLVVSAALLLWLIRDLKGGWQRLGDIDPWSLWPAALVFTASTILGGLQWGILLQHAGVELSLYRLGRLYWIGLFFNNFLPSNVGGDLVKVADVALETGHMARPVAATMLDRILGLLALASLSLIAGAVLGGHRPAGLPWWFLVLVALGLALLGAVVLSRRLGRLLTRLASRIEKGRMGSRLAGLLREFQIFRTAPLFLLRVWLLALVVQTMRVATHIMVARAMGIELDLDRILGLYVLIPILGVAIVLPVSFNGLGLRELVATRLLPRLGIAAEEAFALQLTTYFVQVVVSALGGAFFAARLLTARRRAPEEKAEDPGNPLQ